MKRYSTNFVRVLSIVVLMAIGYAASAQNYYVFHNSSYGYIYYDGSTLGVKTTFDESCLWIASSTIGSTGVSLKSYTDNTKYLKGSSLDPNLETSTTEQKRWISSNNNLAYNSQSGSVYYLNHNGTSFSTAKTVSSGFSYYSVTITNPIMPTFTFSQPAADGSSYIGSVSGTLSVVANVSGSYYPLYYSFNGHYYDEDFTSLGTSVPSGITNFNTTYELIDGSSYASISGNTITYTIDPGHDVVAQVKVTVNPQGYPDIIVAQEIRSFTLYSTNVVAPVITRIEGTNQYTITTTTANATIQYTTDGTDINSSASNGTTYSGPVTVTSNGAVIKARAIRNGTVSDQTSYTVSNVLLLPPVITISSAGVVTITNPNTFASSSTIRYTTNGADPTSSSPTFSNHTATNMQTIKAIVTASGYLPSVVATAQYIIESGVSGNTVVLNDCEDHNWTYYSGLDNSYDYNTKYAGKLYSPNPRNVKITYKGNGQLANGTAVTGVKVGIDANANTFVYYKTIENNSGYKYTTIPNPFSVRPTTGTGGSKKYYGFSHWKVTSITGGTISGLGTGSTVNAETEITFEPTSTYSTNCTSMEVELEAVWAEAEVITSASGSFSHDYGVERMFYVVTSSSNTDIPPQSKACTYTSIYPNGTTDGTTAAEMRDRKYRRAGFTCAADSKFEYIYLNDNTSTINANAKNLTIGRGVSYNNSASRVARRILGVSSDPGSTNYHLRIESGKFRTINFYNYDMALSGVISMKATLGCDYDRALNDNSKLSVTDTLYGGEKLSFTNSSNKTNLTFDYTLKSGTFLRNISGDINGLGGTEAFYMGSSQAGTGSLTNLKYTGLRRMTVEGGILAGIAGAMNNASTDYTNTTDDVVYIRIKGGTIRGSVYGAASFAEAVGNRKLVFTGGTINGWVSGGCNGYQSGNGGTLIGDTYIYIGGNTRIIHTNDDYKIGTSYGGNVFGAGSGLSADYEIGQVNNSNIVIADNAEISRNVYGGGNFGYNDDNKTATIYIAGGTVNGSVFGGANQRSGAYATIRMVDGLVKNGIYGGSNISGILGNNVTIQINGGQVGTTSAPANVHGGGYGNATRVSGSVNITVGISGATDGATIYGDVYGGSAEGKTNGNTARTTGAVTNVTFNAGKVNGNVYGGGLGTSTYAADVWGPVTVTVTGGEAQNVFGCNNTNGAPKNTVDVNMTGGLVHECVYGGGNAAAYTAPTNKTLNVTISGGEVKKNVFGGGLGASAKVTGTTNVKVKGSSTKVDGNVYGGGSAADVDGSTNVTIGEE